MRVDKSQALPIGASEARNKREKSAGAGAVEDIVTRKKTTINKGRRNNNAKREFDDST
jgi:hypothetical protein